MSKTPRVTVCLAVYNGSATLEQALESVFAQTFQDFEVLVLDDGSTDNSVEIARKYPLRIVSVANAGLGAARRRMVEEATGEFVAFIDHDDFWTEDKLERQIAALDATGAVLVHSDCWYLYEDGHRVERNMSIAPGASPFEHILPGNRIIASSAVFRREAMLQAGNFIDETVRCSDWYGWFILARFGQFIHLSEKHVEYNVLSTSLANAGLRFYSAQNFLLTNIILPRRDEIFAGVDPSSKTRYLKQIERNIGVALSGMARCELVAGDRQQARRHTWQALLAAPTALKVWARAARVFSS